MTEIKAQKGPQEDFLASSADIAIYGGAAGGGKALSLDTPIPTPTGWKYMADISVGDVVFGDDGKPCNVTFVSDVMYNHNVYEVVFDDGSIIKADSDHLWKTSTVASRRSKRRFENRTKGHNQQYARPQNRVLDKVLSTTEIKNTLRTKKQGQRINHAIENSKPLVLPPKNLSVEPYILGVWLGDGTRTTGLFSTADSEIVESFENAGYQPRKLKQKYQYGTRGLRPKLRELGVLNHKHIPKDYLRASEKQRMELLKGLMDTDGTCLPSGSCEFYSSDERLIRDAHELILSLGFKCNIKTGKSFFNGKRHKDKHRIKFATSTRVFKLERKTKKQIENERGVQKRRYIVDVRETKSCPVKCITVDNESHLYLASESFIPTHNTYALLLEPLRHINNRDFGAVIFRRTSVQVRNEGGLWDTAEQIYPHVGGSPKGTVLEWEFPSGAGIRFAHLEHEKNKYDWQGAQVPLICFDELTHFTKSQFFYMLSRNRSTCGIKPYVRATTNPDADSWLADFIDWWIGEDGYPIVERAGQLSWFVQVNNQIIWDNSPEELQDKYPEMVPKSVTFIPAKLADNKVLMDKNPEYKSNLLAQSYVDQERLLRGNWKIRPARGLYFKKQWFDIVEAAPKNIKKVRWWDTASTEPKKENADPDYTVGILLGIHNGIYYVIDIQRTRENPGQVEHLIRQTAEIDGADVPIRMGQEPGSSGATMISHYSRNVLQGFDFRGIKETGNKVARANPISAAAANGNVKLVRGDWNLPFLNELEQFPEGPHDDQVDALSGAANELNSKKQFSSFVIAR